MTRCIGLHRHLGSGCELRQLPRHLHRSSRNARRPSGSHATFFNLCAPPVITVIAVRPPKLLKMGSSAKYRHERSRFDLECPWISEILKLSGTRQDGNLFLNLTILPCVIHGFLSRFWKISWVCLKVPEWRPIETSRFGQEISNVQFSWCSREMPSCKICLFVVNRKNEEFGSESNASVRYRDLFFLIFLAFFWKWKRNYTYFCSVCLPQLA